MGTATTAPAAAKTDDAPAAKEKSSFKVLARIVGESTWTELPATYKALEQGKAKQDAAYDVAENGADNLKEAINEGGKGVELFAVSERGYKPERFSMERPRPRLKRA